MKTVNVKYVSSSDFLHRASNINIEDGTKTLIQVFTSKTDKSEIEDIVTTISSIFPSATIIGSTTDGEILDDKAYNNTTIISISQFLDTTFETSYVNYNDYEKKDFSKIGTDLLAAAITDDSKVAIVFADGIQTNGEDLLKGFEKVNKDLVISGGLAGDNAEFINTFVICNNTIIENGAVCVTLNSSKLQVKTNHSFDYTTIGQELIITKSIKNRVYEINGMTAVDLYVKYLGEDARALLPGLGIEFPLIFERDGYKIARAITSKHDDGSLSFAGNLNVGQRVQLGYGDVESIVNSSIVNSQRLVQVESIFIYSCMARKRLLKENVKLEIEPFSNISTVAGFFTYGEFFHFKKSNELLNQTMTTLMLSEKSFDTLPNKSNSSAKPIYDNHIIKALTNILKVTSNELDSIKSSDNILYIELDVDGEIVYITKNFLVLLGLETMDLLGKNINIILEDNLSLMFEKDKEPINLNFISINANKISTQSIISKMYDIEDNVIGYSISSEDVSSLQEQALQMSQQSKKIANVETISALSHQWKQPLNVLSLIVSKLKFYREVGISTEDKIDNFVLNAEETVDTLNRLMEQLKDLFLNTTNRKDSVLVRDIIYSSTLECNELLDKEGIAHNIEYIDGINQTIVALDISKLSKVLKSIYMNAYEAVQNINSPYINTTVSIENMRLKIEILNNGEQIEDSILNKIFTPYFSTKSDNERGLGLYIAKILVDDHLNGNIQVNTSKESTNFIVEVPFD